jgi:hypothetical protein
MPFQERSNAKKAEVQTDADGQAAPAKRPFFIILGLGLGLSALLWIGLALLIRLFM